MDLSVIISTYNRCDNLPQCLDALAQQEDLDRVSWEVILVDNNSSDDTRKVVTQLQERLPIEVRYIFEPQQGLSYARNRGITEARGRCLVFVDDDILVTPRWLASIHECFVREGADAVGGRIHIDPRVRLPKWVDSDPELRGFLGQQDLGPEPHRLDGRKDYPFGGNMSFRREVVARIGGFDPKLGRTGEGTSRQELFKGEEADFFHRLADTGQARILYEPRALVYHRVKPFQTRKQYFRTIHYNAGYQSALLDTRRYPKTLGGIPRFHYFLLAKGIGKYLLLLLKRGPNGAFRQQMNVLHEIGTVVGYRARSQREP